MPNKAGSAAEAFYDWLLTELFYAHMEARKGKRNTVDEAKFESNLFVNLEILANDIFNRTYKPGRSIAFIIHDPVTREIFAAPYRDRIVHHFIFNHCYDWWDRRFIDDSYSCRINKGSFYGIKRLYEHIMEASNGGKERAYVIKLDIQGYFMSLPREGLYSMMEKGLCEQYKDNKAMLELMCFLWHEVIFDDPIKGVRRKGGIKSWKNLPDSKSLFRQPKGQGIVIGNLSSQLLSNIYLDQLDKFVTCELGFRRYGRYVDDFFIIAKEGEEYKRALGSIARIEGYLRSMGLIMHPKKRYIQEVQKGVSFLGCVVYPNNIVPGKRIINNFKRAARKLAIDFDGASENGVSIETIESYIGFMKNINGKKLCGEIFDKYGWSFRM